jgi:hypothetical protein
VSRIFLSHSSADARAATLKRWLAEQRPGDLAQARRDAGARRASPDDDEVVIGYRFVPQSSFWLTNGSNGRVSWKFAM